MVGVDWAEGEIGMWAVLWGERRDSLIAICLDYSDLRGGYCKNIILKDLTPRSSLLTGYRLTGWLTTLKAALKINVL
jgi:hypothetical protein